MLNEDPYIEFVMNEAKKIGKLFMLDTGEGNDCIDPENEWYIEDLSGWLIEPEKKEIFLLSKEKGTVYEEFGDYYIFAIWSRSDNNTLQIEFKKY